MPTDAGGTIRLDQSRNSGQVAETGLEVPATTVDDFVLIHPGVEPRILKLDIEGHELRALAGADQTIAAFAPLGLAEFGHARGDGADALRAWLAANGYKAYAFTTADRGDRSAPLTFSDLTAQPSPAKMVFPAFWQVRGPTPRGS